MSELRKKTSSGFLWELMGSYGGQLISFIISIFLARLLTPAEFGIVGMSMVFLVILQVFREFGFSSALIQQKQPSSLAYSSVFYINIAMGLMLTTAIYFSAPFVADFYNNQPVKNVLRLLSFTFLLNSFNIVQGTILTKEFNFKFLTTRTLIAQSCGGGIGIVFAFSGFGVYALVIQQIVAAVISTILLWKVSSWRPSLSFSWFEVKKLLNFSSFVFLSQLFASIVKEAETLLFGKFFSASFLGFFTRANSLNKLIYRHSVSSLSKVIYPAFSEVQDEPKRFNAIFLKLIELVSVLSLSLTGVFYLAGESLIITLFGNQWGASIPIFKILILRGFTVPINMIIVNTLLAKGMSKQVFIIGRVRDVLQLSIMPIAYYYGVSVYLYTTVVISILAWLFFNYFISKHIGISYYLQLIKVLPNAIVLIVFVFFVRMLQDYIEMNFIVRDLICVVCFLSLFLTWLYISKSIFLSEIKILIKPLIDKLNE